MKKIESQKQLFEDVFAVEHIHSSKNKLVIEHYKNLNFKVKK